MLPELWEHQKKAIELARHQNGFALFFDVGTGKTRTAIEIMMEKYKAHNNKVMSLVFCPPIAISNWKDELLKYSEGKLKDIVLLTGSGQKRYTELKEHLYTNPFKIFVTNYEFCANAHMANAYNVMHKFIHNTPQVPKIIIADEMHKIKSPTSSRTKGVLRLANYFTYRYGLTGTPFLSSVEDLWSQFYFLDSGQTLGTNFYQFKKKYFVNINEGTHKNFPTYVPMPGSQKEIERLTINKAMSAKREDCINLPPLIKQRIEVELSPTQNRHYKEMKKYMVTELNQNGKKHHAVANLAITKAIRLQQIITGHVKAEYVEDNTVKERVITLTDNPRLKALKELLETTTQAHKVIVWSVFIENFTDIKAICDELGLKYAELHGGIRNKDEERLKFTSDPDVKVMIGHPRAGGIAINLVEASVMIYYSRDFSLESEVQSEARCFRAGSDRHDRILRYDIVAKDTIDELILKAVEDKQAISDEVIENYIRGN